MHRRSFLVRFGGAVVAVPAVLKLTACGDDGGNGGGDPDGGGGGDSFTVSNQDNSGHSHTFTVECSQLDSSSDVTFTATGGGHTHSVTLTAAELGMVANGETVTVETSDLHPHTWMVSAANNCS